MHITTRATPGYRGEHFNEKCEKSAFGDQMEVFEQGRIKLCIPRIHCCRKGTNPWCNGWFGYKPIRPCFKGQEWCESCMENLCKVGQQKASELWENLDEWLGMA